MLTFFSIPRVRFTYVLEYCSQGDLESYLRANRGAISIRVLRHFFKQIG